MAEERSIIYKVDVEIGELTKGAAKLATSIDEIKNKQKELTKAGQQNSQEFQNNATQLRALQREYKNTTVQIDNQVRATTAADKSYEQLLNTTKQLEVQLKTMPNAFDKNNKEAEALRKQIDLNKTALLGFNAEIQDGRLNVGNYGNNINALKQKFSDLQDELQTVDLGSDRFKDLQKEITKTRDQIGFAEGRFDEFGERIKKGNAETLDTFNDVGQGITAAFAIAPLFGENAGAAELQANALKAIAVAQNSVAIAKGISNLNEAKGIVLTKASAAGTLIAAAAQGTYNTVIGTSTGLMKAARIAMLAIPIVAIVAGLVALVANWESVTRAVKDFIGVNQEAAEATAEENRAMAEQSKKAAEQFRRQRDLTIASIKDERKRRIRELEVAAERELEIEGTTAQSKKMINQQLNEDIAAVNKEFRDKEIKEAQEASDKYFDLQQVNAARRIKAQLDGSIQELALFDLETQALIRAAQKRGEDLTALQMLRAKERLEINQKVIEEFSVQVEESDKQFTDQAKKGSEFIQENAKKFSENLKAISDKRVADAEQATQREIDLLDKKADATAATEDFIIGLLSLSSEAEKKNAVAIKAVTLGSAITQGFLAVQRALAFPPGPPATIPSAISTGAFAALNVAKIAATPAYARGGITGKRITSSDGLRISRSNGDNLLATVRTGEVILNERHQRALGGARTFRSIGVPGFADGGFTGSQIVKDMPGLSASELAREMKKVSLQVSVTEINEKQNRVNFLENERDL